MGETGKVLTYFELLITWGLNVMRRAGETNVSNLFSSYVNDTRTF